ncbi:hypothetical protein [Streptomyces sp. NRRL F-5123]|uniref:hypothetical protein n=1 Tax=Streptomyces sp. NRRL F-5123 TaxID=1463856 RepID=UPI0004E0B0C1|nr:hypothetical protein [Streptomyces sp. NRRL F-5123]
MGLLSWLGGGSRSRPDARPAATADPETAGRSGGEAWRELPPIQRTTGDLGLVTDPGGFRASLDTWQDVSLSRPLGHVVSPEAPSGTLYDIASASPEPPPAAAPEAVGPGTRTWAPPSSGRTGAHPAVALQRILGGGPLTSAAAPPEEAGPVVVRPLAPPDAGPPTADEPSSVRELPAPPLVPPPGAEPPAPPAVQRAAPPGARPAAPPLPPPATPPVQRTTEQPAVRPHQHLGIGEPLPGLPPTARGPAARSTPASVTPEPAAPEPLTTQSSRETPDAPPPVAAAPPGSPADGPLLGDSPLLPPAPAPDARTPASDATEATGAPGNPLALVGMQRLPADLPHPPPPPATGPEHLAGLVGERPVPLFARTDGPGTTTTPAPDPEQPVVARWATEPPAEPARRATPRPAVPTAPYVQRSSAAAPGGATSGGPPAPRPEPRRSAANRPWTDAGSVAIAAGVAQRTADGSVVFTPPSSTALTALAVQRAPDPATAEPEFAPSAASDSADSADSSPDPGGPAATTTSKPADPARKADGEDGAAQHVDDALVRALFPRLSRLLKDELRRDRERAGFLINTRH